ncbi:MAG: hypothetical protein HKN33_00380 [Pyrinomonadaceae bacterium]|nr:hypothetical protein [Pyrinomonadaceae bacterium]
MPKKKENKTKKPEEERTDTPPEPSVEDQLERGYYYDDAHGYQTYKPEKDTDDTSGK